MEHDWFNAAYDRDTPLVRAGQGRTQLDMGGLLVPAVALAVLLAAACGSLF